MLFQIPVKLPPTFEVALGYKYGRRWVAFYWEPSGDEAMFDDGICSGDGNYFGYLEFIRHPKVRNWLRGYNLGGSDYEASHWLLCDLQDRDVFVGERRAVIAALVTDCSGDMLKEGIVSLSMEILKGMLNVFEAGLAKLPPPSVEEVKKKMLEDIKAVEAMKAELERRPESDDRESV